MKTQTYTCAHNCCHLTIATTTASSYPHTPPLDTRPDFSTKQRSAKAGIIARHGDNILIVQSYGHKWGFPKGSVELTDTVANGTGDVADNVLQRCAYREFTEETGIVLDPTRITLDYAFRHDRTTYFTTTFPNTVPAPLASLSDGHEITGIGWIRVACLYELVTRAELDVNAHLRRWIGTECLARNGLNAVYG